MDQLLAILVWYGAGAVAGLWLVRRGHHRSLAVTATILLGGLTLVLGVLASLHSPRRPASPSPDPAVERDGRLRVSMVLGTTDDPRSAVLEVLRLGLDVESVHTFVLISQEAEARWFDTGEARTAARTGDRVRELISPLDSSITLLPTSALGDLGARVSGSTLVVATERALGAALRRGTRVIPEWLTDTWAPVLIVPIPQPSRDRHLDTPAGPAASGSAVAA